MFHKGTNEKVTQSYNTASLSSSSISTVKRRLVAYGQEQEPLNQALLQKKTYCVTTAFIISFKLCKLHTKLHTQLLSYTQDKHSDNIKLTSSALNSYF